MASFKLMTYETGEGARAGLLTGDGAFDVAGATGEPRYGSVMAILADWDRAKDVLGAFAAGAGASRAGALDRGNLRLLAPIPMPGTIYCAGANYRDHVLEMARAQNIQPEPDPHDLGLKVWHFIKSSRCVVAPDAVVPLPPHSKKVDWEAELGVVIGRTVRRASEPEARNAIAGYTVVNDISMRDWQYRTPQWDAGKTWEHATPVGPWLVTPDEVDHARDLRVTCEVDGVTMQDGRTSDLLFDPIATVRYLSTICTLEPGDLISTGTPSGVGHARKPPVYLQSGQLVHTAVEGIGALVNRCVPEPR
jgi:acylpyruvate hydrolase